MSQVARILIVDDHIEMARLVADDFREQGLGECQVVDSGGAAIAAISWATPDLVVTDLRMSEIDGLDVLEAAKAADPDVPVIVMTGFGAIDSAVEAMRRGAWHYVTKPVRLDELRIHAARALAARGLRRENRDFHAASREAFDAMIGRSDGMRRLYDLIERVAPSPSPVLIRGESGTGKELVARAIHGRSPRRDARFVAINCTALPEALLESELFGHARGSFTGATTARGGLFVEASGGTLFLDEIGDMPASLQAKLLRVVQLGEIRPVGADESRRVDVRLLAATHQDLEERVKDGGFRADLYYRLNVVPMVVPPLRERAEDIGALAEHFLEASRARNPHSPVTALAPSVIATLAGYGWPGNVRELENVIERLVVVGTTASVDLPALREIVPAFGAIERFAVPRERMATLRQLEDEYIAWVLARCDGNKTRAAEVLGVDVSTIHRRTRGGRDSSG
jgi:two-component system response regulator HydG